MKALLLLSYVKFPIGGEEKSEIFSGFVLRSPAIFIKPEVKAIPDKPTNHPENKGMINCITAVISDHIRIFYCKVLKDR